MIVERGDSPGPAKHGGSRKGRSWKNLSIIPMDVILRLKDCENISDGEVIDDI